MTTISKNNSAVKISAWALWYTVVFMIAALVYRSCMETNPNGESCSYNEWHMGLLYQWIWSGDPCFFTSEFYFQTYFFFVPLLILYEYIRRKIIGFNPGVRERLFEAGVILLMSWSSLLWLTHKEYSLTATLIYTSLVGTLLYAGPLALLLIGMRYFKKK